MSIKRLYWDIETSPNICLTWRVGYKINIDHDNLLKERAIICIGYKWEGEKAVHSLTWDEQQNDRAMLERFMEVADQADELVAHNGDGFDMPWLKTRCIYHDLPTLPAYKTVDTLQWARRRFLFNSNRLDYIARFLGMGGKIKTEFGLWKSIVLENDREALGRMVKYCKRDVALLEQVWRKMAAHVPHKTHAGVMAGKDKWTCPHDGSENVRTARGFRVTANGSKRYQMQCLDCNRSYSISEPAYRQYQAHLKEKAKKEAAA